MKVLHNVVQRALSELPELILSDLITKKLASQGVNLSARERKRLASHVLRGDDTFHFKRAKSRRHQEILLDFTPEEVKQVEQRCSEFLDQRLPGLLKRTVEDFARKILADLRKKWQAESLLQHREIAGFRKRLYRRWKIPLEKLRMLVTMCRELGDSINFELRKASEVKHKHLVEVLTRSHARACQISEEIICLLDGGFADGAMARWRTLYEVAVVAEFIGAHGEELAERYVLHQVVESRRAAHEYERCRERLGYPAISESEINVLEISFAKVIKRFGPEFGQQYGWAAQHLGIPRPNFANIERAIGSDHFRSHYRMASHNVHANPKGVFFKLGLMNELPVLLSGPSNAGLADPGHGAAIALARVSGSLTVLHPTLDNNIALLMLSQVVDEIGEGFGQAHKRLEQDEASLRPK